MTGETFIVVATIFGFLFGLPIAVNVIEAITNGRIKASELYKTYGFT